MQAPVLNPLLNVWTVGLFAALAIFQIAAVPAILRKRNDFADVTWGPAFIISALAAAQWGTDQGIESLSARSAVILALLTIWAVRLFVHIRWRTLNHPIEDARYQRMRKNWGSRWILQSYLRVFVMQPLILYAILVPVLFSISANPEPWSLIAWLGLATWIIGFLFESVADEQLRRFKQDPANKCALMTRGLWGWSRHPNYFGEVVQWWGIWLMVQDLPLAWTTILSPVGLTFLIIKVSGVSLLEGQMKSRPGYEEYCRTTSSFIPWFK